MIVDTDPDFQATGLKRTSFAAGDEIVDLRVAHLIRKRGQLQGGLLQRFLKWIN